MFAYALYAEVLRENAYLSRTVEVQENQKVIATGLYGIVRHPMYMSTLLLFLSMPLVLGSVISFVIVLLYIPIINKVALLVFNHNDAGNAFWEKQGFTVRDDVTYRNRVPTEMVRIDT